MLYRYLILILFATHALNASLLLQKQDEQAIRQVLAFEAPDIDVSSVRLISSGWDNLVADINGEWIFRFPRTEAFRTTLEREIVLLDSLQNRITMPIPHYELIGKNTCFVCYRKIQGIPLTQELYLSLSNDARERIAEELTQFFYDLHHAVSVEEVRKWGYSEHQVPLAWIEQELLGTLGSPELERIVFEALCYAKEHPTPPEYLVLAHNDLHGDNLAFDASRVEINGVFDFSDAILGDYAIDLGKCFNLDPDFGLRTSRAYARLNSCPNPALRAVTDFILRRATAILCCRQEGELARIPRLLNMLEGITLVWDSLKVMAEISAK